MQQVAHDWRLEVTRAEDAELVLSTGERVEFDKRDVVLFRAANEGPCGEVVEQQAADVGRS